MTDNLDGDTAAVGHWTFECQKCDFTSEEDTEVEALNAVDAHADYGPGHFDFIITDPNGVEQYP